MDNVFSNFIQLLSGTGSYIWWPCRRFYNYCWHFGDDLRAGRTGRPLTESDIDYVVRSHRTHDPYPYMMAFNGLSTFFQNETASNNSYNYVPNARRQRREEYEHSEPTEHTSGEGASSSSDTRTGLSEESRVAATAALSRLQKQTNKSFTASMAQVKRELQKQKAATSKISKNEKEEKNGTEFSLPKTYAASEVFFRCPQINNDVLPRHKWKNHISKFFNDCSFEEERWLSASLIIQSCNDNREEIDKCVEILIKYLQNIVAHPEEEKYRKIKMTNRAFCERVQPIEGALELLQAAGFNQKKMYVKGVEEDYMVFSHEKIGDIKMMDCIIDALRSAQSLQLELDRDRQVLFSSHVESEVHLPPCFYDLTSAELKREQQLRTEATEKRETKELREMYNVINCRPYKFAIIRVRFPDEILLQGTFSVHETYNKIHEFVQENIENTDLPFFLSTSTGRTFDVVKHGNQSLIALTLVPATELTFAWESSSVQEANKNGYLRSEVMDLLMYDW